MRNTKQSGRVTVFAYQDKRKIIAVCLELDIVHEASTFEEARAGIIESVQGYIEAVYKGGFSDELLNRPAPQEYWNKFYQYLHFLEDQKAKRSVPSRKKPSRAQHCPGIGVSSHELREFYSR